MVLKQAFNAVSRIHSRAAKIKRLGSPDIYSPIRITPSNYFRYLEGPSQMVIHGREFIIPIDTMKGHATQLISFSVVPTLGGFYLTYNAINTSVFPFNESAANIQIALRLIAGLSNITVTGNFTSGFLVTFIGVDSPLMLTSTLDVTPLDAVITISESTGVPWIPIIKRADKIIDPTYGPMAIDEIIEIVDIGGEIMGFRVRAE